MADKYRWILQLYWEGDWRELMKSDKRIDLVKYAEQCSEQSEENLDFRIVDATEEVNPHGRRH